MLVHPYIRSQTNTFQGLVITNGTQSYAVFTYKCDQIKWGGGATVGFKADGTYFRNYDLSGQDNVQYIGCVNQPSTDWNNLVYTLVPEGKCKGHTQTVHVHKCIHLIANFHTGLNFGGGRGECNVKNVHFTVCWFVGHVACMCV